MSQGSAMVARRSSFRSSTSLMVYMMCMLPTLSWMLSEAGASLMGQVAVVGTTHFSGTAAVVTASVTAAVSAAAAFFAAGGVRPSAPRSTGPPAGASRPASTSGSPTGAGEQARVDLVEVIAAAHHSAELLAILWEGDGAALGQFQALAHALHAYVDIAAVGQGGEGVSGLDAGLLPAQGGRVFVAGEIAIAWACGVGSGCDSVVAILYSLVR